MKILIVDDDESNLLLTKLELRDERWKVITASNGREAVELCKREKPDVVIVDVKMPDMDGIVLLKALKEITPNTPMAIFTGYDKAAVNIPEEADALITKSSAYTELKGYLRKYDSREQK